MNNSLQNPFAHDTPDSVDSVLAYAAATCCQYNQGAANLVFAGQLVATGRTDGVVAIWDAETKGIVRWLVGHTKAVLGVAWSPHNRFLASCSCDCSIIIWDLARGAGEQLRNIKFDTAVLSVRYDPSDSNYLVAVLETQEAVWIDLQQRIQVTRRRVLRPRSGPSPSSADKGKGRARDEDEVAAPAHTNGAHAAANGSGSGSGSGAAQARMDAEALEPGPWEETDFAPLPVRRWVFGDGYETPLAPFLEKELFPAEDAGAGGGGGAGDGDAMAVDGEAEAGAGAGARRAASIAQAITCVTFSNDGRHVFAGTSRGSLLVYDVRARMLVQCEGNVGAGAGAGSGGTGVNALLGNAAIRELCLEPATGGMLLVNSSDRKIYALRVSRTKPAAPRADADAMDEDAAAPGLSQQQQQPDENGGLAPPAASQGAASSAAGRDLTKAERTAQDVLAVLEAAAQRDAAPAARLAAGVDGASLSASNGGAHTNGHAPHPKAALNGVSASASASAPASAAPVPTQRPFEFELMYKVQDRVNRTPWCGIGFTGDGEYVFGGATNITAHNIYIWERLSGTLNKILEGPKEPLIGLDWHPHRPAAASVSSTGNINLWFTPTAEIWSAYAPGFEELEENIEYEEREDEFDVEDEAEATRRKKDEEEGLVDIYPAGELVRRAHKHVREVRARAERSSAGAPATGRDNAHSSKARQRKGPPRLPRAGGSAQEDGNDSDDSDNFWDGLAAFSGEGVWEEERRAVLRRVRRAKAAPSGAGAGASASAPAAAADEKPAGSGSGSGSGSGAGSAPATPTRSQTPRRGASAATAAATQQNGKKGRRARRVIDDEEDEDAAGGDEAAAPAAAPAPAASAPAPGSQSAAAPAGAAAPASGEEAETEEVTEEEQVRIVLLEDRDDDPAFALAARLEDPTIELNSDSD